MKIISDKNVLDTFCSASEILYKSVAHTLGPNGYNTAVSIPVVSNTGRFSIINDGLSIIMQLSSDEPEVAAALEVIKEVAVQTNKIAGDGTTSSVIFIYTLLSRCRQLISDNRYTPLQISNILKQTKTECLAILESLKMPLSPALYKNIISTSMGSTSDVNDIILDAFNFAGSVGDVLFKRVDSTSISVNKTDAVVFSNLHIMSPECLPESDTVEDCRVLAVQSEIQNTSDISSLLAKIKSTSTPTVLICEGLAQPVKEFLYKNILSSGLTLYPVILSGNSSQKRVFFDAVELITGTPSFDQLVKTTRNCQIEDLPIYKSITIKQDRLMFNNYQSEEFTKMCIEKNYKIPQRVAEICIGSDTVISAEELYMRVEDTVNSLKNAILSGIVVGGGFTYAKVNEELKSEQGKNILWTALNSVLDQNLKNLEISEEEFTKSVEDKVFDSYEVCKQVISNSIDIVCSILSTKVMLIDKELLL